MVLSEKCVQQLPHLPPGSATFTLQAKMNPLYPTFPIKMSFWLSQGAGLLHAVPLEKVSPRASQSRGLCLGSSADTGLKGWDAGGRQRAQIWAIPRASLMGMGGLVLMYSVGHFGCWVFVLQIISSAGVTRCKGFINESYSGKYICLKKKKKVEKKNKVSELSRKSANLSRRFAEPCCEMQQDVWGWKHRERVLPGAPCPGPVCVLHKAAAFWYSFSSTSCNSAICRCKEHAALLQLEIGLLFGCAKS